MNPEDRHRTVSEIKDLLNKATRVDPAVNPALIHHVVGQQAEISDNLSNQELEDIVDQEIISLPEQRKDTVAPVQRMGIDEFIDPGTKYIMGEGNWFRDVATDQQLIDHSREYLLLLKIAMLAEEIRQTQGQDAFDKMLQALDTYWSLKKDGKPNFTSQSIKPGFKF